MFLRQVCRVFPGRPFLFIISLYDKVVVIMTLALIIMTTALIILTTVVIILTTELIKSHKKFWRCQK